MFKRSCVTPFLAAVLAWPAAHAADTTALAGEFVRAGRIDEGVWVGARLGLRQLRDRGQVSAVTVDCVDRSEPVGLNGAIVRAYAADWSAPDLQEATAFYRSGAGRKSVQHGLDILRAQLDPALPVAPAEAAMSAADATAVSAFDAKFGARLAQVVESSAQRGELAMAIRSLFAGCGVFGPPASASATRRE